MNLGEAFAQFLDRKEIRSATREKHYYKMRRFVAKHADIAPSSVTTAMLLDYIDRGIAEATKAMEKDCFRALFNFCGMEDCNPADGLPCWSDVPKRIVIPPEQAVKMAFDAAVKMCQSNDPVQLRNGLIFTLAVVGGNRRGEIRNLRLDELLEALAYPEESGMYRVFTQGKTETAVLRFTDFHKPYIMRYLAIRPMSSEYVFVNLNPSHERYGQQLSLVAFDRVRPKVCSRAGVPIITYQELRRRLATTIAREEGVDVAASVLGHSPHSGDRVIRLFYFDPDKAAADRAAFSVFKGIGA